MLEILKMSWNPVGKTVLRYFSGWYLKAVDIVDCFDYSVPGSNQKLSKKMQQLIHLSIKSDLINFINMINKND